MCVCPSINLLRKLKKENFIWLFSHLLHTLGKWNIIVIDIKAKATRFEISDVICLLKRIKTDKIAQWLRVLTDIAEDPD